MSVLDGQPQTELKIDVDGVGSCRRLRLSGELDLASAGDFEAALMAQLREASALTLDLSELSFMDSTGVRAILSCLELCEQTGCKFALMPGQPQVQRVFELCALLDVLPFVEPDE